MMIVSAFVYLGLLSHVSKTAFAAPAPVALIDPRFEDSPTTSTQEKRLHRPIRPFPVGALPLPPDYLPEDIEPSHSIKPSLIPLAPGPVLPDYAEVAIPLNPTLDIESKDTDPHKRRYVVGDTDESPSTDRSAPNKEDGFIDSLPLTVDPSLPMDVRPIVVLPRSADNKEWQSSTTDKDDRIFSDRASYNHGFNVLVEEIHHPANDIYRRHVSDNQALPSTITSIEDDTTILENNEVLKQSLIAPNEVKADYVVIHQPKHEIFRRWRKTEDVYQDNTPGFKEVQDSNQFETKLVIHHPANNIYRRGKSIRSAAGADRSSPSTHGDSRDWGDSESSDTMSAAGVVTHHPAGGIYRRTARASPTRKVDDEELELELSHHWGHGPVVFPRPGKKEHSFDESIGHVSRKRDGGPILSAEYLDIDDWYKSDPTTPAEKPINPYIANPDYITASPATGHYQENSVHRRHDQDQIPKPDPNSPLSRRHHDNKHTDPFHLHATESEPVNSVYRRQSLKAIQMIPDATVHWEIPDRKHKHGHDRREIQNTSGGIAKFLVPAAVVHLKLPGKKHDRRDILGSEEERMSITESVQRREARSSSSDGKSDNDDGDDQSAAGDEAEYLKPDTYVHKRPGNDQGHKKDDEDNDKKKHSRSIPIPDQIIARSRETAPRPSSTSTAASANNRDGDRATQHMPANYVSGVKPANYRREAKKDEKKEKENGDRQSSRPNIPVSEPDYHPPKDRVYRRQSGVVDPGENVVQHPVEEVVFKRPGGREWVA